jgi:hypothetical protein
MAFPAARPAVAPKFSPRFAMRQPPVAAKRPMPHSSPLKHAKMRAAALAKPTSHADDY